MIRPIAIKMIPKHTKTIVVDATVGLGLHVGTACCLNFDFFNFSYPFPFSFVKVGS